jgi:YVTN family beta-propeller protein
VSAEAAGEVVCIDAETGAVSDRIRVGERPRGLRLSRDGRRLFVALAGDAAKGAGAGLAIVDVRKRKLLRQVAAGPSPFDVDVSPDGRTAYLSSTAANQLTIVDVASGQPKKKVAAGAAPEGIAVRADGKVVYVTAHGADEVHAIDAKKMELVRRMDAGPGPRSVLFSPAGDTAFVVDETLTTVTALDSRQHTFKHAIPLAVRSTSSRRRPRRHSRPRFSPRTASASTSPEAPDDRWWWSISPASQWLAPSTESAPFRAASA